MIHPAVPNRDTLAEAPMTGYPIHIDQGCPNVLDEDHISYCKTVRGPDILRNVIFRDMLHSTKPTDFCKNIYF